MPATNRWKKRRQLKKRTSKWRWRRWWRPGKRFCLFFCCFIVSFFVLFLSGGVCRALANGSDWGLPLKQIVFGCVPTQRLFAMCLYVGTHIRIHSLECMNMNLWVCTHSKIHGHLGMCGFLLPPSPKYLGVIHTHRYMCISMWCMHMLMHTLQTPPVFIFSFFILF